MKLFRPLLLLLALSFPLGAQNASPGAGGLYNFGIVATTGQLGSYLSYVSSPNSPTGYTIDWNTAGTAASACTFQPEGSSDRVHWYALNTPSDCTTANMIHIADKPVVYFRIDVLTFTKGDITTAVTFNYTRG